jgi:hypothetical protein
MHRSSRPTDLPTPRGPGSPAPVPLEGSQPGWLDLVVTIGLLMMLILFGLLVFWMVFAGIRQRGDKTTIARDERIRDERLVDAVETGLVRVESGTPTDAVIACWVALEQAAAAIDVPRRPAETAAEFTARVFGVSKVSQADLHTLAELYREARYSTHGSSEEARATARETLTRLRAELLPRRRSLGYRSLRYRG